jgi:hypothetical protein
LLSQPGNSADKTHAMITKGIPANFLFIMLVFSGAFQNTTHKALAACNDWAENKEKPFFSVPILMGISLQFAFFKFNNFLA